MLKIFRKQAQSSLEYVTMVIIVIGALIAMQNYFKRGVQGRWRSSADGVGEQYDPMFTEASVTQRVRGNTITNIVTQNFAGGIKTLRSDKATLIETKDGYTRVDAE